MHKIFNQIGLAYRAKKVVLGTDNIIEAMKRNQVSLIILGTSASIGTQKLIQDKARTNNVDVMMVLENEEKNLSKSLGKKNVKVLAIKDKGFKKMMIK